MHYLIGKIPHFLLLLDRQRAQIGFDRRLQPLRMDRTSQRPYLDNP